MNWRRPLPSIGDRTSAADRRSAPGDWAFEPEKRAVFYDLLRTRRDVRRFRSDAVDDDLLMRLLAAAHAAPSVGHSQPWRFVIVRDDDTRAQAAWMADRARLNQAAALEPDAGRHLLDLRLEGIREAPVGIVVCCDRRVAPAGVLGRATFTDADTWSCVCAIENLWLAARAEGLGLGWVTLFEPDELAALIGLPAGVHSLGWLCLGWPDERPPDPSLERAGWSRRLPLADVVIHDRWPDGPSEPARPVSKVRLPQRGELVSSHDDGDTLLTPPGSLGVLDWAVERAIALGHRDATQGVLVLAAGRHPVVELGVSAFDTHVAEEVLAAAHAGEAFGAAAAAAGGLGLIILDGGSSTGNIRDEDALDAARVQELLADGIARGAEAALSGIVALGEVGIGNTTVAAALASALLGRSPTESIGLGAGADWTMLERKRAIVDEAVARLRARHDGKRLDPLDALAGLGGPEFALLAGVVMGAAANSAVVVLDGLATSVAALVAARLEPAVTAHLIAGQRSREAAHPAVLSALGLEPLLDLRLRAGEGIGAVFATGLLLHALDTRRRAGRTA